jgi:hypothetical protein
VRQELLGALSLIESEISCWNDAAHQCEKIAPKLSEEEQAEYMLLGAVYRERADMLSHDLQRLAASIRQPSDGQHARQQDFRQSLFS